MRSPAAAAGLVSCALSACGTEPAPDLTVAGGVTEERGGGVPWPESGHSAADAADTPPHVCRSDDDCEGGWCVGPPGCEELWVCTTTLPCSAAPPSLGCTCAGRLASLASGCPGAQYGHTDPSAPDYLIGTTCDPSSGPPRRVDLRASGHELSAHEGQRVAVVLVDPIVNRRAAPEVVTIRDASFSVTWPAAFNLDYFGYRLLWWIDVDGDGVCTAADARFESFANNTFPETGPVEARLSTADAPSRSCP